MTPETCTCDYCREDFPLSDLISFRHYQLCPTYYEDETTHLGRSTVLRKTS